VLKKLLVAKPLFRLVKFYGDCGHNAANINALARLLKYKTLVTPDLFRPIYLHFRLGVFTAFSNQSLQKALPGPNLRFKVVFWLCF
jgi:hypothetical protein